MKAKAFTTQIVNKTLIISTLVDNDLIALARKKSIRH